MCSDLRDICPHCTFDLRPQKKVIGVKIVNTAASYEELLRALSKKPKKKKKAKTEVKAAGSSATELSKPENIQRSTEKPDAPNTERKAEIPPARVDAHPNQSAKPRPNIFTRFFVKQKPQPDPDRLKNEKNINAGALQSEPQEPDQTINTKSEISAVETAHVETIEQSTPNQISITPSDQTLSIQATEKPKPEVLDLSNEEDLISALDQMLDGSELEIESVKKEKANEEIEFEFEFEPDEGGQVAELDTQQVENTELTTEPPVESLSGTSSASPESITESKEDVEPAGFEKIESEASENRANTTDAQVSEPLQEEPEDQSEESVTQTELASKASEISLEQSQHPPIEHKQDPSTEGNLDLASTNTESDADLSQLDLSIENSQPPLVPAVESKIAKPRKGFFSKLFAPVFSDKKKEDLPPQLKPSTDFILKGEPTSPDLETRETEIVTSETKIPTVAVLSPSTPPSPLLISYSQDYAPLPTVIPNTLPSPAHEAPSLPAFQSQELSTSTAAVEAQTTLKEEILESKEPQLAQPDTVSTLLSQEIPEQVEDHRPHQTIIDELDHGFPDIDPSPDLLSKSGSTLIVSEVPAEVAEAATEANAPEILTESLVSDEKPTQTQQKFQEFPRPSPVIEIDDAAVQALFDMMLVEMDSHAVDVELSFENLAPFQLSEEILVLFDMSEEVLDDSNAEFQYQEVVATSTTRSVENEALVEQLNKAEVELNPEFSLSKGYEKKLHHTEHKTTAEEWQHQLEEKYGSRVKEIILATIPRLGLAFLIDQLVIVLITGLFSLGIVYQGPHSNAVIALALGNQPLFSDAVVLFGVFASLFLLITPIYPLVATWIFGKSVGLLACSLTLYKENGTPVEFPNLFVRSATLPLSILFFGYVPIFFGHRSFHDRVAKTVVGIRRGKKIRTR